MQAEPGKTKAKAKAHLQLVPTDLDWTSTHVSARDGLRLHVRTIGSPAAPRVPLLCLPGLSRNVDDFDTIGRAVAAIGDRQVVALDSRGRGGSQYDPDWRNYDLKTELDDLHQVLIALGIEKAVFFGTSRGGLLTAMTGIVKPETIHAAILNDIGPVIEARGLARIRSYVGKLPRPRDFNEGASLLKQVFGTHFTNHSDEAWMRYARRTWADDNGRFVARYDTNLMRPLADLNLEQPMPDLSAPFATLDPFPLMVIRGELSDILSEETSEGMVARHPNARLHVVPYEGHAPLLEDEPTIAAVKAFLAEFG
ncbi:MAG TPA: alpha/beta hydrolase [Rhabdaerophilum sp.]|nr:alpha/beta hydrolase [Rhabdaerophilum sp.]